ncbi:MULTISPECIES: peptidylprolyl isomerase [Vibrio]|uniref:Peptidyl-prolyl cis-trans isomerase n=2 Tax=Vibrio TaxID=662 RepID=A0A7X4LGY1_9VIBR|nr:MULTISPECIES: peptidylprolyl isomerase [Vibrio]MBF8999343.1 peptidyl-prolyl cis-trans isomerase [Vibrio nitrifigilis]MZI91708.1 peptidyl-prolyl cis-trans isomerase [Vibrio eleionomae]
MAKWCFALFMCFSASIWAAPTVVVDTSLGSFTVELNQDKAPITVKNFLRYVKDGSYEGSIFHRIIPGFMAQGGGFDADLKPLQTYKPIKNESTNGLRNDTATIAMARTQAPDSATRQFFINFVNNGFLNARAGQAGYAVFGKVVKGFDVVKSMAKEATHNVGYLQNVPEKPIIIRHISLVK